MRVILAALALLSASSLAFAQPAKAPAAKTPEQLLPADCVAYFRYDGYAAHRKAYDQTALAKVMKEGLGDFLDHVFSQLWSYAGDDFPPRELKKGEGRRQAADRFLEYVWKHGFAATFEFAPGNAQAKTEDLLQLTVVFPQGAEKKNREAIENLLKFGATAIDATVENLNLAGRIGHALSLGEAKAAWWPEGEHLVLTVGTQPAQRALRVIDGRRPNLTTAKWHAELTGFKHYETDMRGHVDLEIIVDRMASYGLQESGLANIKERLARHVVLRHLGLTGLKNLSFHLGFDGKYQRSTVRLGVVEPDQRPGLLRLLSGPIAYDEAKLPPLPPDADYVSVRHVDWQGVYEYLRSTYTLYAFSQLFEGRFPDDQFPDLDKILGVDFRKDFLQQLDTSVVTWGAHSEGPFFLGQGFAVKVKDVAKVRKSLQAIGKKLGEVEEKLTSEKKMYRGHEMQVFTKLPIPLTYTLHNDWLVFGLFPQPVQGYLLRSGGKYRVWKAPPETAVAFAKQNGKSKLTGMSVSDPRPTIEIGLALMPTFAQYVNAFGGSKVLDVSEIPNAQSINEWLFHNVMLSYDDGNALRWENLYSINEPDDLLLVQFAAYAVPSLGLRPFRFPFLTSDAPKGIARPEPVQRPVNADDLKQPVLGPATAVETDGVVQLRITIAREVSFTVPKTVPVYQEKIVIIDGEKKKVKYTSYQTVYEQVIKIVNEVITLRADGKNVKITRKDGKTVEPKELLILLKEETQVLFARDGPIDRAVLEKLDERTLVIRVAQPAVEELPPPRKGPINEDPIKQDPRKTMMVPATAVEEDGSVKVHVTMTREITLSDPWGRVVGYSTVSEVQVYIADGKKVQVTRKYGKAVEPKDLPMLLKKETRVLLARDGEIERAVLETLDERTLIVRVAP